MSANISAIVTNGQDPLSAFCDTETVGTATAFGQLVAGSTATSGRVKTQARLRFELLL